MRAAFWSVAFAAAVVVVAGLGPAAHAAADIGQTAPSLVVKQLDGQTFDLSALRGKVVIINFWATWCLPCREEMPALNAFYRRYHDQGLEMIGLSAERPRARSEVTKVMQSFSYPAAMLNDSTADGFGTPSVLPITFVIDRAGVVRVRLTPSETSLTEKGLADVVLPLLLQSGAATPAPK